MSGGLQTNDPSENWSDELATVVRIPAHQRSVFRLRNHFQTLRLTNRGIAVRWVDFFGSFGFITSCPEPLHLAAPQVFDPELGKFGNLIELDVSENDLADIKNLPDSLEVLNALSNSIVDLSSEPFSGKLQHLGVSFNRLRCPAVIALPRFHRHLMSLDLSYNALVEISPIAAALSDLEHLRMLCLAGNPLSLLQMYRSLVCSALPRLKMLDNIIIEDYEQVLPPEELEHRRKVGTWYETFTG